MQATLQNLPAGGHPGLGAVTLLAITVSAILPTAVPATLLATVPAVLPPAVPATLLAVVTVILLQLLAGFLFAHVVTDSATNSGASQAMVMSKVARRATYERAFEAPSIGSACDGRERDQERQRDQFSFHEISPFDRN